jgi:hypothetical protein
MFMLTVFGVRAHPDASNTGNVVDIVIGLVFAVLFQYSAKYGADWDNRDDRPMPELQDRWAFLGCYAILVLSLVIAMMTVQTLLH